MLTCPTCRFRAKVSVYMQQTIGQGMANKCNDDEPTQINFGPVDATIGVLYHGATPYALHLGVNTIGRIATTSSAEVQISHDRYMSRQHAVITIEQSPSGYTHQLKPTNPRNPIKVNGLPLHNADIVMLQWGDRLTFGHTELIFERPQHNEEITIISS